MLFIFSLSDFQLQYADKEALERFKLSSESAFTLFDIHPDLQLESFRSELDALISRQQESIERVLRFSHPEAGKVTGRFRFSFITLGGHDFVEAVCEACSLKGQMHASDEDLLFSAQKSLLASEKTMATIIDLAVDGVVIINAHGIIQGFNRAAEKMFGFSNAEAIGQNVSMLAPEPHRSKHDSYIQRFLKTRIPHIVGIGREVDAQRKNGELFPIDLAVGEVRLESGSLFTGFIRDLSESRKLISERNSFFQMSLDMFCILDFQGTFKRVNPQWQDVMGYAPEDLQGQYLKDIIHPDDLSGNGHILEDILGGRNVLGRVLRLRQSDGSWRWMLWNSTVDRANRAIYGVSRDITEQKRILEELQNAKDEAERSSQAKGVFIAKMSHEFRTPLNSIIGFSRHLQKNIESRFSEREMLYLDRISRNGETLLKLINSILDFSRSENHHVETELTEVNLQDLLAEIIDLMQVLIEEKHIGLELVMPEVCVPFRTDAIKLRQIIQNIVDNAVKFTSDGQIKVELITDSIGIARRIDVTDTGPGIEADKLDLIFEAFQQADNRVARKYGGAGLGLAIARSFAELIGASIEVCSITGKGSCFSIVLPDQEASET
ncbi:MAG: PAS domain S-box protein [Candidatus Riflebacteria bacterium]|nr:PAS domain S-box protein [Candidatus Riflebacteria bacterium]